MATYKPLQSVALTSATTSITFSGIDQNYTDLVLVANTTVATASGNLVMTFNGDATSGLYSKTQIEGTGSVVTSNRTTGANNIGLDSNMGSDTTNPSIHIINLTNYSNTSGFKTILHRQSSFWSANPGTALRVGLWRNTNAINSITLTSTSINFNAGSTFDLYGIKSGAPQALGGDLVTTDGNYWYHTFRTTQTFTPQRPLTVDYLVVAGGGGSGAAGGGGGAGGYRTSIGGSSLLVTTQAYSVTVGAGGVGTFENLGTNGSDSIFATITSTGGGGGASDYIGAANGKNGGSGGGGPMNPTAGETAGTGNTPSTSPSQGNNGGAGSINGSAYGGGGGGGSSVAGSPGSSTAGGAGGAGTSNSISGSAVTYAGGGGGGTNFSTTAGAGGAGGGGAGTVGAPTSGNAGTVNTGGGGGGSGGGASGSSGANGGSGIVIVRYPV
jgi:hypothetical protein